MYHTICIKPFVLFTLDDGDDVSATTTDVNDIFLTFLFDTLSNMHDNKVPLSPQDRNHFCRYIRERCLKNLERDWEGKAAPIIRDVGDGDVDLVCYVKSFGTRLFLTFVPASLEAARQLVEGTAEVVPDDG